MDAEAQYAYYCIHKFHWEPSKFAKLSPEEKAFVVASIDIKIDDDRKREEKFKEK